MAGMHVQVIRSMTYKAPAIMNTDKGELLVPYIDTLGWKSGVLVVRVYANSLAGTGATLSVAVANSMVSSDNPAVNFDDGDNPIGFVQIIPTTAAGKLLVANLGSQPIGRYVRAFLMWVAGAQAMSGSVTLGVDLVGRDV